MARHRLQPEDLEATAAFVTEVCRRNAEADWSRPAGTLEWSVRETVIHMASTCTFYALHLSSLAVRELPVTLASTGANSNLDLIDPIAASAKLLATVARFVPDDQRGFHAEGRADAEGFLAMGCSELLVHTADVAAGLDCEVALPKETCRRVVDRLYPWAPPGMQPAAALLWANGRIGIDGSPPETAPRAWHCAPIDEPE